MLTECDYLLLERERQITAQLERIEQLESTLAKLQHARFGASSEKNPDQGERQFADEAELIVGDDPELPRTAVSAHSRKGVSNKPFPAERPRVEVHHNLEGGKVLCACGEPLREIGTEVSEPLAVVPCRYYVVRHICHRYGCRCGAAPMTAHKPPEPQPGSALHPTLIASSIVDKYLNGCVPRARGSKGLEIVRNFTIDEGLAPRSRFAGADSKPLQAAGVKSSGGERCSKRCGMNRIRWDRQRRTQVNHRCRVNTYLTDVEAGGGPLLWDEGRGEPVQCSAGIWHKGGVTVYQALVRNEGTCRLDAKGAVQANSFRKGQSTDVRHRDGGFRSRVEGAVMALDQREAVVQFRGRVNSSEDELYG